jgi:hypothetical protein
MLTVCSKRERKVRSASSMVYGFSGLDHTGLQPGGPGLQRGPPRVGLQGTRTPGCTNPDPNPNPIPNPTPNRAPLGTRRLPPWTLSALLRRAGAGAGTGGGAGPPTRARARARARAGAGAKQVILCARARVLERLEGPAQLDELLVRVWARVLIWVQLDGLPAIRALDLSLRCVALHAQNVIVVSWRGTASEQEGGWQ